MPSEISTQPLPYFVYFDSTRKVFSVRDQHTRRVVYKAHWLVLDDCRFLVSEKGRQRVLRERRKTVHAGIGCRAYRDARPESFAAGMSLVSYNPFRGPDFVRVSNGSPVAAGRVTVCRVEDGRARVYVK